MRRLASETIYADPVIAVMVSGNDSFILQNVHVIEEGTLG